MTFHQPDIKSVHRIIPALPIIFILFFSIASCSEHSKHWETLNHAEALMEEHPDSALSVIDGIDEHSLSGRKERARYALLKSMALDKNYVDTTDFAVLQPAIDYYLRHGSPDQKFRTLYYQGRIFQNRGENAAAMNCYLQGQDLGHITDTLTLARLLTWQGIIQKSIYEYEAYQKSYLKATNLFDQLGQPKRALDCNLSALNASILLNDKEAADSIVNICVTASDQLDLFPDYIQPYLLEYYGEYNQDDELWEYLAHKASLNPSNPNQWLALANAYHQVKEPLRAKAMLDSIPYVLDEEDSIRFYAISTLVYEELGDYENAFNYYKTFTNKMDTVNLNEFEEKARFSKERHEFEIRIKEESEAKRLFTIYTIGGIIFLILIIVLLYTRFKANKLKADNLHYKLSELEKEHEELKSLNQRGELPGEVKKVVRERFEMLNSYLMSEIAQNNPAAKVHKKWMASLIKDKGIFMANNRLAIQGIKPEFVEYLAGHGLTESELDYACLCAIGLNGKEIGQYLERKGHVNISSAIRQKLGLTLNDTNLYKFLQQKFNSM